MEQNQDFNSLIQNLSSRLTAFEKVLNFHKHTGYDLTDKLPPNRSMMSANITTTAVAYTVLENDYTVLVNAVGGARVITLPQALKSNYRILNIKKIDAAATNVTITAYAGDLIDGAATKVLAAQWATAQIQCNGSAWYVL